MPAPDGAPAPPARQPKLGAPARWWEYRDAAGRMLGRVYRFNPPNGGKETRSLVFGEHKRWGRQWRWLGFPRPRPLYGLDRLAARPDAPVIVTEGEKAAGAADWSVLAGRRVTIWPDADEKSMPTRLLRYWRSCRRRRRGRSSSSRKASPMVGMPTMH